ncbi:AAA family ATPase [Streptomyces sp. NPDC093085]|uniref:AAA family ATPase n=1 Tax=Streptomyces sp. NPDC093085 TaxID=3155068 RepID=UPI00342B37BF
MRDNTRAEVRDIAGAVASETVMRYADALARSPYALQTMTTTATEVATEVANAIADQRVAQADEIVRAAETAAGNTATETARQVAEKTAAELATEKAESSLRETREELAATLDKVRAESERTLATVRESSDMTLGTAREESKATLETAWKQANEALSTARTESKETLSTARRELSEALGKVQGDAQEILARARRELEQARQDITQAAGEFARAEAVRTITATVAESVPPVVEVRVARAEPIRVSGHTHSVLPDVLLTLGAGCQVLLVGPAGTGKSMMAKQAAEAFGQEFHALSLGPTTPMSKIFGYYDAHGKYHGTPFRSAFERGGLMLLDELDSGHPGLLAELNQALSIRSCAFADGMVTAHPEFRLVATANTYGTGGDRQYVGRQALDAATLDRFVVVDVPVDEELEERIALAHAPDQEGAARKVLKQVRRLRATAAEKRLPVMFSPRASIDAAKLLQAGASVEQVVRWRVTRGMSEAHRSALGLTKSDGPAQKPKSGSRS